MSPGQVGGHCLRSAHCSAGLCCATSGPTSVSPYCRRGRSAHAGATEAAAPWSCSRGAPAPTASAVGRCQNLVSIRHQSSNPRSKGHLSAAHRHQEGGSGEDTPSRVPEELEDKQTQAGQRRRTRVLLPPRPPGLELNANKLPVALLSDATQRRETCFQIRFDPIHTNNSRSRSQLGMLDSWQVLSRNITEFKQLSCQ